MPSPYFLLPPIPRHTYRLPNWYAGLPYIRKQKRNPVHGIFQLAIARCAMEDKEEAIATARQLLQDEYLHLFLFLLDENTLPEPPYNHPTAWMVRPGLEKAPQRRNRSIQIFRL